MTQPQDIKRLAELGGLILDHRMAALRRAAQARAESQDRLANLAPAPGQSPATPAEARAALLYQVWADRRRAEINMVLARQTVAWMEARDRAAHALGQADVLGQLLDRAKPPT